MYLYITLLKSFFSIFFNRRNKTLQTNALLTLDPNVSGVFTGPYPFGIDPVSKRTQVLTSKGN